MATFRERLGNAATGTAGSRRMLIVIAVGAALAATIYFLTYTEPPVAPSEVRGLNNIKTVQGQTPVSPEYDNALRQADQTRVAEAERQGGTVMPTIRAIEAQPIERPDESGNRQGDYDGVNRPAPPVVAPPQIISPVAPIAPPPIQVAQAPIEVDPLVEQMRRQLETFKGGYPAAKVDFYSKGQPAAPVDQAAAQAQSAGGAIGGLVQTNGGIKLPLAGSIVYAELVSTANSDAPGPVIARIVQGELAGATLIGSFQTQRDALFISFQTLSMGTNRQGDEINKSIPINAVAVDSSTIGTGLATSVDRHLLQNVGITAAAAFAQGLGSAIAQSGQQVTQSLGGVTVTNPIRSTRDQLYIAGGVAGGAAGQALQQAYGNRPVTITVASGTPMGILFLPNRNF